MTGFSQLAGSPVTEIGRLRTRNQFLKLRDGDRVAMPGLVLQALPRADTDSLDIASARFGFTATRTIGGAVQRNRVRRRLREAVRLAAPAAAVEGYDYVLIARAGTLQRRFAELVKDLERALAKVHQAKKPRSAGRT